MKKCTYHELARLVDEFQNDPGIVKYFNAEMGPYAHAHLPCTFDDERLVIEYDETKLIAARDHFNSFDVDGDEADWPDEAHDWSDDTWDYETAYPWLIIEGLMIHAGLPI